MTNKYNYIYGPVPSRRFGLSLGIDLTPNKTCSLDCIYCQLGRTTDKTILREDYVPVNAVLAEIDDWVKTNKDSDYITLSGSGEPTLHTGFGEVLYNLKKYPAPSALLTNGTMLYLPEVREAASHANLVKISLSAWDDHSYYWVNRPYPELTFDRLISGQKDFRAEFKGELWMEIVLMYGINSLLNDVNKISEYAQLIKPDRIHLNTVVRPPSEEFAVAVSNDRLKSLSHLFDPPAEVITEYNKAQPPSSKMNENDILTMLRRRPCTSEQLAKACNIHLSEVTKHLSNLIRSCRIHTDRINSTVYYSAINKENRTYADTGL